MVRLRGTEGGRIRKRRRNVAQDREGLRDEVGIVRRITSSVEFARRIEAALPIEARDNRNLAERIAFAIHHADRGSISLDVGSAKAEPHTSMTLSKSELHAES
jgi:hypothetical protein